MRMGNFMRQKPECEHNDKRANPTGKLSSYVENTNHLLWNCENNVTFYFFRVFELFQGAQELCQLQGLTPGSRRLFLSYSQCKCRDACFPRRGPGGAGQRPCPLV